MGAGRGGSSPGRSPNDDRSDAKNPNNAAYWHDQANRFGGDEDCCAGTLRTRRSKWDRRRDRIEGFERRIRDADMVLKAAEDAYFEASLPLDIAREAHSAARVEWERVCDGRRAYEEADALWEEAALHRRSLSEANCDDDDDDDDDMMWMDVDTSREEWEKVVALEAEAAAAVYARKRRRSVEPSGAAWDTYTAARNAYAQDFAAAAVARAQVKWRAAEKAVAVAQDAFEGPARTWDEARAAHDTVRTVCRRAIDRVRREKTH